MLGAAPPGFFELAAPRAAAKAATGTASVSAGSTITLASNKTALKAATLPAGARATVTGVAGRQGAGAVTASARAVATGLQQFYFPDAVSGGATVLSAGAKGAQAATGVQTGAAMLVVGFRQPTGRPAVTAGTTISATGSHSALRTITASGAAQVTATAGSTRTGQATTTAGPGVTDRGFKGAHQTFPNYLAASTYLSGTDLLGPVEGPLTNTAGGRTLPTGQRAAVTTVTVSSAPNVTVKFGPPVLFGVVQISTRARVTVVGAKTSTGASSVTAGGAVRLVSGKAVSTITLVHGGVAANATGVSNRNVRVVITAGSRVFSGHVLAGRSPSIGRITRPTIGRVPQSLRPTIRCAAKPKIGRVLS